MTDSLLTQGRLSQVTNDTLQKYNMKNLIPFVPLLCKEKQIVSFESRKESFCKEKGLLTSLISTIVDIHKGNALLRTHSISCLAGKT